MPSLCLIAALAKNRVIGHNNTLPWHLPEDLAFFKRTTLGHAVVMGRRTYQSIGKPLPGRTNVVVSSQAEWAKTTLNAWKQQTQPAPNTTLHIAHSLADAIQQAQQHNTIFIVGGARIYQEALAQLTIDKMVLTELDADFEGDAYFPAIPKNFVEHTRTHHAATTQRPWAFDVVEYHATTLT